MNAFFRSALVLALSLVALGGTIYTARAQQKSASNTASQPTITGSAALSQAQIDEIIRTFTAKETQFRKALNEYAFKRDALIQTVGMGSQVTGEYHRVSDFTFDDQGTRFEKISFFPMSTLDGLSMTAEDLEDLGGVNPFALEAAKLNLYNFKYVGKERIDELDLYVFDVAPKVMPKKTMDRFFIGRIWVDDHDLQIVKSKGKAGPETKNNKFPTVETYREQIDGRYWFPTYAYADDDLVFDSGQDVRLRMRVKYSDYKVGRGKVTITELDVVPDAKPENKKPDMSKPDSQPKPTPPPMPSSGSDSTEEALPPVEGGFVNSKATSLPAPDYPAAARKDHITGEVQVKVLIDETGKVISAEAVFGPEQLRDAAVTAAKRAVFAPTKSAGVPVKVNGILTYSFPPR
jgi:TonB family protein